MSTSEVSSSSAAAASTTSVQQDVPVFQQLATHVRNISRMMLRIEDHFTAYDENVSTTWVTYPIPEMGVTVVFTKSGELPDIGRGRLFDLSIDSEEYRTSFMEYLVQDDYPFDSDNRLTVSVPVGPDNEISEYMRGEVYHLMRGCSGLRIAMDMPSGEDTDTESSDDE